MAGVLLLLLVVVMVMLPLFQIQYYGVNTFQVATLYDCEMWENGSLEVMGEISKALERSRYKNEQEKRTSNE